MQASNLTQTGVLTVAGTSSFMTSANNADIVLNNANLLAGAVCSTPQAQPALPA